MRGVFASSFARSVEVTDGSGGTRTLRAFLQPLNVEKPETPLVTAAGVSDPRRWLLILEAAELPEGPVEVADGGDVYELLRRENISGHIEGILRRKGGAANA